MRVLVCGGREYDNLGVVLSVLSEHLKGDTEFVIEGGAKGADFLGRCVAKYLGFKVVAYPADWKTHGKAAGGIRNQQMLDEGKPDLVIAFPGGVGTADMVRRAKAANIEVIEIG